jgi:hypothetical protein
MHVFSRPSFHPESQQRQCRVFLVS